MRYLEGLKKTVVSILSKLPEGVYVPQSERELVGVLTVRSWVLAAHGVGSRRAVLHTCQAYHYRFLVLVNKMLDNLPPVSAYQLTKEDFETLDIVDSTLFTLTELDAASQTFWTHSSQRVSQLLAIPADKEPEHAQFICHPVYLKYGYPLSLANMTANATGKLEAVLPLSSTLYLFTSCRTNKDGSLKDAVAVYARLKL